MATGKTTYVPCINFLASHALMAFASSLTETSSFFTPHTRARHAHGFRQIKYFLIIIDVSYRRYGVILLIVTRTHISSKAEPIRTRTYAITFDRETFDDAIERFIKHTTNAKKKFTQEDI